MMQVIYGSAQNKAHSFFLKCNIKYFLWKYSKWQTFFNKNVFSSLSSKMLNQQLSIFVLSVLKLKGWFLHQQCVKTKTKGLQKLINTHTHTQPMQYWIKVAKAHCQFLHLAGCISSSPSFCQFVHVCLSDLLFFHLVPLCVSDAFICLFVYVCLSVSHILSVGQCLNGASVKSFLV